jgi:lipid II:glycine glycyltransferase (peptidoglycan interpeptide bridge formation enzyme)
MKADISIQIITENQKSDWNKIVAHPLQSWAWGEFRKKMGIQVVRIGTYTNGKLTDGWQLTFHQIPHTPLTVGYFPKGPQPTEMMIARLNEIGIQYHAIFIQLEPNIIVRNSKFEIRNSNLKPSHHPLFTKYTFILDLTKSEDELLAAMHPKTRYNLRVAQKHGVVIREDNSPKAFYTFVQLSEETTIRQKFLAHNRNYQIKMWETMHQAGIARLFTAVVGDEIVAAWILFFWNDTVYYPYGASGRNRREIMAPNLLLWEIVKNAKASGYKKFDLWGAIGPNPDPNDPWYGFHRFKQGYNPELVEFAGSFDLVINPVFYKLYCLADDVRWKILQLKNNYF